MWKRVIFVIGVAAMVLSFHRVTIGQVAQFKDQAALAAAQSWLAVVDQGQYGDSWDAAGAYFKKVINKENWVVHVSGMRSPLGNLVFRRFTDGLYDARPDDDLPQGDYCVFHFNAKFEHQALAIETVTLEKEKDGQWRVAGYVVK